MTEEVEQQGNTTHHANGTRIGEAGAHLGNTTHHANGTALHGDGTAAMSEQEFECTWYKDDFFDTAANKKAISAQMFILFVVYTAFVLLRHKFKDTGVSIISILLKLLLISKPNSTFSNKFKFFSIARLRGKIP